MRRLALVALVALACGALPAHAQAPALGYKRGDIQGSATTDLTPA